MWADSWNTPNWGTKLARPIVGAVCTFTRSGGGHVGVCEKYDDKSKTIWLRGCNQSDMVNLVKRSMSGFTEATWPPGYPVVDNLPGDTTNTTRPGSEA